MKNETVSPLITSFSWGHLEVAGGKNYKDAKLFPGGSESWDWNETGTHHVPGIQPADVSTLLEKDCHIIILSRGVNERLQTSKDTIELLEKKKLDYQILQTEDAIETYNQLARRHRVGALIHSTC
jgi:hypothetical protein